MGISYKPFLKFLIDNDLQKKDIVKITGISWATMSKFSKKGEYIELRVIEKICKKLNKKGIKCQPNDIMEYIEN